MSVEQELAALHERSFGWALTCCRRDHEQAREVLQIAYFKVLSGRARFDERSAFKTWLFGVIRLTAMEERRFRWFRGASDEAPDIASDAPSPSSDAADRQIAQALGEALGALAPRQREVLHLVFYEGQTVREAAAVMGVSPGTASLHYDRGKARLLQILTARGVTLR